METLKYYIRTLSYKQACDAINYMNSTGGEGNIVTGAIAIQGTVDQIEKLLAYLSGKGYEYDIIKRK